MSPSIFNFNGAAVRVVNTENEVWFIASDVCGVLELSNQYSSLALLDDDEKGLHSMETHGGRQDVRVISESGLYSLILRSRKPEARAFKKWVTSEVLPAIRKTGTYSVAAAPQFQLPATMAEALRLAADSIEQLEAAKLQLADAAPKLITYDKVMSSDSLFTFPEVASLLAERGIGSVNLVKRLEEMKILYHEKRGEKKGKIRAYSQYISEGYFKAIERPYEVKEPGGILTGEMKVSITLKVTVSGVEFIARRLTRKEAA